MMILTLTLTLTLNPHCFLQVPSKKHGQHDIQVSEWLLQPSVALIGPSQSIESDRTRIYESIWTHFRSVQKKSKNSKSRSSLTQALTQRDPKSYHSIYYRKNGTEFGWWSILRQLQCSSHWQTD